MTDHSQRTMMTTLKKQFETACLRLLNAQNRDPYAPAYGCFDRRYWGWKLVDYPEATFQRAVYPLAWLMHQDSSIPHHTLQTAVIAGLQYSIQIQHRDGSFDQAFPHEHSFGATAFLLHPLLYAYEQVQTACDEHQQITIKQGLKQAAVFLSNYNETHGHIANHLAGGALSLLAAARFYDEPRFEARARHLIQSIIDRQSSEGWYTEYEGADPGYQTLGTYYLAQCQAYLPDWAALHTSLEKSVAFLQHFVHPDATFGGEYGSRRTAVYYAGGIAILADGNPIAHQMTHTMLSAITSLQHINALTIDIGNLVPLLSSWVPVLDSRLDFDATTTHTIITDAQPQSIDFPEAGLHIRKNTRYTAIIGSANGGVIKVFADGKAIWDDGGYVAHLPNGTQLSTQVVDHRRNVQISDAAITIASPFYAMKQMTTSPLKFVLLRLLNITVMRHIGLGNLIKALLVRLLITGKQASPLHLKRRVVFSEDAIRISDTITTRTPLKVGALYYGIPFVSIHMASARYFALPTAHASHQPKQVDATPLAAGAAIHEETVIQL